MMPQKAKGQMHENHSSFVQEGLSIKSRVSWKNTLGKERQHSFIMSKVLDCRSWWLRSLFRKMFHKGQLFPEKGPILFFYPSDCKINHDTVLSQRNMSKLIYKLHDVSS